MLRFVNNSTMIAICFIVTGCSTPEGKYVNSYTVVRDGCARVSLFMNVEKTEGVANIKDCISTGTEPALVTVKDNGKSKSIKRAQTPRESYESSRDYRIRSSVENVNVGKSSAKYSSKPLSFLAEALANEKLNCDVTSVDKDRLIHIKCTPYDPEAVALLEKGEKS